MPVLLCHASNRPASQQTMILREDPAAPFEPDANEREVRRIGDVEIGSHVDRITLTDDVVLTREQADLALAQDLRALIVDVVQALEADPALPETVHILSARTLRNPLSDQSPHDAGHAAQAVERTPGCPPAA